MAHTGKNKAPRSTGGGYEPWFIAKQRQNKKRKKMQKASKRANRR